MRILTWNLERGFHGRKQVIGQQQDRLKEIGADIAVLTEVPAPMSILQEGLVLSPVQRAQGRLELEAWVGIAATGCQAVGQALPFARMAAAAQVVLEGEPFLVYGSVLPWRGALHQAKYLSSDEFENSAGLFKRILCEQVEDMKALKEQFRSHSLIWAGDFNQSLSGPNYVGSKAGQELLSSALEDLDLEAWNKDCEHSIPGLSAIDLICGPKGRKHKVERFAPDHHSTTLSDHAGYIVEL